MALSVDQRAVLDERAAIMEFDGHLSRSEAERLALKIVEGRADEAEQVALF